MKELNTTIFNIKGAIDISEIRETSNLKKSKKKKERKKTRKEILIVPIR